MGNSESKNTESRVVGGAIGGSASAAGIGGGIALMVLGGPVGMVAGGILLGTGISTATSTVQQCATDKEFSYTHLGVSAGVGALGGVVGAPFSIAGGAAASTLTSTAAKVTTMVTAEVVGGGVSGGITNTISQAAAGEEVTLKSVATGALIGGLAGGIGSAAGQATSALSQGAKTVGKLASKTATAGKIAVGAAGGAAGGSGVAALTTFIENVVTKGELKKSAFIKIMKDLDVDESSAEKFWDILVKHGIIVDEVIKKQIPKSLELPDDIEDYREVVEELIKESLNRSLAEGVGNAAIQGAVTGGISGAITTAIQNRNQRKMVKAKIRERAEQVKKGAVGGSMEIEMYARENKKRVIVHHDNGKTTTYGSKSATAGETHLHYSAEKQHYSPADTQGKRIPTKSSPSTSDCLFQALAHQSGDDPAALRQKLATTMHEKPLKLTKTTISELSTGGLYHGGGSKEVQQAKKMRTDTLKAIENIKGVEGVNEEVKKFMKDDAMKFGIKELNNLTEHAIKCMENKPGEFHGRRNIHYLVRDLEGLFSVDVHTREDQTHRGPHRLLFRRVGKGFEFVKYSYHYQ